MIYLRTFYLTTCLLAGHLLSAQSYTRWISGDTSDVTPAAWEGGLLLAGGGSDNDNAMRWMLQRAGGGDILILRASGSDGYNSYLFSELGVPVNSVETIRFNNASAAQDPYILHRIATAEAVFFAGGDQYDYYTYWKDNAVETAINRLLNEKRITIGGTSAGMAILGDAYYTPPNGSLTSAEGLSNPFHSNTAIIDKGNFLQAPFMTDVITDTHYDQRARPGRHVVFLARLSAAHQLSMKGIACNEGTAVCVDTNGIARVFGEYPAYNEVAYFLKTNCQDEYLPEVLQSGTPLTWNRTQAAVKSCKVPGHPDGLHTFNLNDWEQTEGGIWNNWYVQQGVLLAVQNTGPNCDLATPVKTPVVGLDGQIIPNPFQSGFRIAGVGDQPVHARLYDLAGRLVWDAANANPLEVLHPGNILAGCYFLEVTQPERKQVFRMVKTGE